jgi:arylsulfatase
MFARLESGGSAVRLRDWTKAICVGAALLALPVTACGRSPSQRLLLLLSVDTLRADRIGAYGSPLGLTPNLDALLAESQLFTAAFAPCAYTLPSVSALLTGRYPEELGMQTNASLLDSGFQTLASVLRLYGWRTGAVVSNYVLRKESGVDAGFELFDDAFPQREENRLQPERVAPDTTTAALALLDRLREGAGAEAPLFLWVHYQDPHGPYQPPQGFRERFLEAERAGPQGRRSLAPGRDHLGLGEIPDYQYVHGEHEAAFYRAGYDGEIAYLDAELGRLLEGLRARGLRDDALVVFTADHGEGLGERDYWFAHGEYLDDALVRVPLAIRIPGEPGRRRDELASLVDLFPTLLGVAGVPTPSSYPGRDLLAPAGVDPSRAVYLATLRGSTLPRHGLVAEGWKYVVAGAAEAPVEELFRIEDGERDRSREAPEVVRAMRERLERVREGLHRPAHERRQALTPTQREQLRALGYVEE